MFIMWVGISHKTPGSPFKIISLRHEQNTRQIPIKFRFLISYRIMLIKQFADNKNLSIKIPRNLELKSNQSPDFLRIIKSTSKLITRRRYN